MFRQLLALPSSGGDKEKKKKQLTAKVGRRKQEKLAREQIKRQTKEERRKASETKKESSLVDDTGEVSKRLDDEAENDDVNNKRQNRSSSSGGSSSGYLSGQTNQLQQQQQQQGSNPQQTTGVSRQSTLARQNGSTYHFEQQQQHQSSHMMDARSLNHHHPQVRRHHLGQRHPRAPSMVPMVIDDDDDEAGELGADYSLDNVGDEVDDDLDVRQMLASHRQRRRVVQAGDSSPLEDQRHSSHLFQRRHLIDGLRASHQQRQQRADLLAAPALPTRPLSQLHANGSDGLEEDEDRDDDDDDEELDELQAHERQFKYTSEFDQPTCNFNYNAHPTSQHHFYGNQQARTLDPRLQRFPHAAPYQATHAQDSASLCLQRQAIYYQPNLQPLSKYHQQQHFSQQRKSSTFEGEEEEAASYLQSSSFLYHKGNHNYAAPTFFATTSSRHHHHRHQQHHKPLPPTPVRAQQQQQQQIHSFAAVAAAGANVKPLGRANYALNGANNELNIMQTSNGRQHLTTSPDQHHRHHHHQQHSSPHARRNQQQQQQLSSRTVNQLGSSQLSVAKQNLRSVPSVSASLSARATPTPAMDQNGPPGGGGGGQMMPPLILANQSGGAEPAASPMGCCGKLVKFLLFVANALFWSAGLALGAWGILALVDDHKYNLSQLLVFEPSTRMSLFQLLAWSFITLGCATILVGFCGCSALVKNSRWILGLYIFLILAIFALDLATGLLAIIFQERLVANVRLRLVNKLRNDYGVQASFTAAIDYIQTRYECCGLEGHFDYDQSLWRLQRLGGFEATVARTCCHLRNTLDDQAHVNPRPVNESMCQSTDVRFHQSYRYRRGCLDDLERLIRNKIWTFTIGCGAVGAIILLSLVFATCFCRSIKPNNRDSRKSSAATATGNRVYQHQQAFLASEQPGAKKTSKHKSNYR